MIMTSLIRLIVKVYKWLTFFKEAKQFGLVGPVWGCCHERQFNKHVQKSKRAKQKQQTHAKRNICATSLSLARTLYYVKENYMARIP